MFRKLHLKLTGLCALITTGILVPFAALYLSASEQTLQDNHMLAFQRDFSAIQGALEQQQILTYQYLLQLESSMEYHLFLWDNGVPLAFNQLSSHAPFLPVADLLFEESQTQNTDTDNASGSSAFHTGNAFFRKLTQGQTGTSPLLAGQTTIRKGWILDGSQQGTGARQENLTLLVLAPEDTFLEQLARQRTLFAAFSLGGCLAVTVFAWFFTGRLLKPIRENHQKQLKFVADASHELRTPLAVILSSAEVKPPHFDQTILQEVRYMGRLVDNLLTLASQDAGAVRPQFSFLAPDTLALEVYEQWEPVAARKGLSLCLQLPEDALPGIRADAERIRQLLMILLQNATNYTPQGGSITIRLLQSGKFICFQVVDTGIGIDDREKDKIFERFYRTDPARQRGEHFGLGLSLAREIVQNHRGRIQVTDTPGGGSTFSCYLPVNR